MEEALNKLQGDVCAAIKNGTADGTAAAMQGLPADLQRELGQLLSRMCTNGTDFQLGSMAPQLQQLLGGGVGGIAAQLDALLGTNGTIAVRGAD